MVIPPDGPESEPAAQAEAPAAPPPTPSATPATPQPDRWWQRLDRAEKIVSIVGTTLAIIIAVCGFFFGIQKLSLGGFGFGGSESDDEPRVADSGGKPAWSIVTQVRASENDPWVDKLDIGTRTTFEARFVYENLSMKGIYGIDLRVALPLGLQAVPNTVLLFRSGSNQEGQPISDGSLSIFHESADSSPKSKTFIQATIRLTPNIVPPCNVPLTEILRAAYLVNNGEPVWSSEVPVTHTRSCPGG